MSRMFVHDGKAIQTWNPYKGCLHECKYCWARQLAEGKLRLSPKYQDGFTPKLVEHELSRRFHQGLVFVSDMGDLFGYWVLDEWIRQVFEALKKSPNATFLFLTKNPGRYIDFLEELPKNTIWGTTIESDVDHHVSKAPPPVYRFALLSALRGFSKMVSIEPIMDFTPKLAQWIAHIRPEFVYVGYDNHSHHLPEPPLEKTKELIKQLGEFTEVRIKTLREAWNGATGH